MRKILLIVFFIACYCGFIAGCAMAIKTPYGTVDFALTNEDVLRIMDIVTRIPRGAETTRRTMIMTTDAGQKVLLQVGGAEK